MKSKDTQFAAVKLPKCLERPHNTCIESTKNNRMQHRSINISRDDHIISHSTTPNPTGQYSRKTSLVILYAHGVISQLFTISCHFRDRKKLDQKGRERWGRVARVSLAGRSGGEGQDKVHSRIQLVEKPAWAPVQHETKPHPPALPQD